MSKYPDGYKDAYVQAVTSGKGWAPGQKRDAVSPNEREFRARMEERKTRLLSERMDIRHPVTLTEKQLDCARKNIKKSESAARWFQEQTELADHLLAQDADFIERLAPALTSVTIAGFTCPRCVGKQSGEGFGAFRWDYRTPDVIHCDVCGQPLPDAAFPETGELICPRRGQSITFHRTEAELAHPDDHTGRHARHWVGKPMAMSFSGLVRERKIRFMFHAALAVALVYRLGDDARHAALAARILLALARRFPNWLYHDFYGAFADCDPLYAAAHDKTLPLDFKRHPYTHAYGNATYETGPVNDTPDKARMLTTFFGASRVGFPGTHGMAQFLGGICMAYDLTFDAKGPDGRPVWSDATRMEVERNLILEYALESEPWLGGPDQAQNICNKAPEVYHALAAVGVCLGLPDYAHIALLGVENIRDRQFLYDGISIESALYMDAYLSDMIEVTELLHGFRWPAHFTKRSGVVDVYGTDPKFRQIMLAVVEQLRADGTWLPLSDTMPGYSNRKHVFEICARRYPGFPSGLLPHIQKTAADWYSGFSYKGWLLHSAPGQMKNGAPTLYGLFNMEADPQGPQSTSKLPEIFFPAWMTAILRHGQGPDATDLVLAFNPPGGHRHADNLSLFYSARGRGVLGDLGYMADTPFLGWYHASLSHNLVAVDDQDQLFQCVGISKLEPACPPACSAMRSIAGRQAGRNRNRGEGTPAQKKSCPNREAHEYLVRSEEVVETRRPALRWMVASPRISAVAAESQVYPQCTDYRRTVMLIKGPNADTFAVDIFRVKGGRKHVYRLFSELAASDSRDNRLEFAGLSMPSIPPFPDIGGSVKPGHVYGLLDPQRAMNPPPAWQALWSEAGMQFRMHMFTPADAVETAHGPGQERREIPAQIGRRVRYVNVIREGENLESVFVAIHEPSCADGSLPILKAERLPVPAPAGTDAVALRIESKWGSYLVLSEFEQTAVINGVQFQGALGIVCRKPEADKWCFSVGAGTIAYGDIGIAGKSAWWEGQAVSNTENRILAETKQPADWPADVPGVQNHVIVEDGKHWTGFPVQETGEDFIKVQRFPLQKVCRFRLPAVRIQCRSRNIERSNQ